MRRLWLFPRAMSHLGCRVSAGLDDANLELLPIGGAKNQPRIAGHDPSPLEAANGWFLVVIRPDSSSCSMRSTR